MKTFFDHVDSIFINYLTLPDYSFENLNKDLNDVMFSKDFESLNLFHKALGSKYITGLITLISLQDFESLQNILTQKFPNKDLKTFDENVSRTRLNYLTNFFTNNPDLSAVSDDVLNFICENIRNSFLEKPDEKTIQCLTEWQNKLTKINPTLAESLKNIDSFNSFNKDNLSDTELAVFHQISIDGLSTIFQMKKYLDPDFPEKDYFLKDLQFLKDNPDAIVYLPDSLNPQDDAQFCQICLDYLMKDDNFDKHPTFWNEVLQKGYAVFY